MKIVTLFACAAIAVPVAFAQQPNAVNARVVATAPPPDVMRAIAAIVKDRVDPAWIGYAVPAFTGDSAQQNDGWSQRCRLEQQSLDPATNNALRGPIRLEPAPTVMILLRAQTGEIRRVRAFSGDCQIDAGGLTLYWLGEVSSAQSVDFLKALIGAADFRDRSEGAFSALALHRDPAATAAMVEFAKTGDSRMRQRALVWVGRRAESQAAGIITRAIDDDPDVEVKKQAVFALSQLPRDESIPMLIRLARSHTHPIVRKQAMFWLGQSKDPRALSFFEEVLR
jgi:hypothetical protein